MKTIRIYAYASPETMYEIAREAGPSEKAANYFRYFEEVALDVQVDEETGEVVSYEIHRNK